MISKDRSPWPVGKHLDFDLIYELTKPLYCQVNGQATVDPLLFFRMPLVDNLLGTKPDHELCRKVHLKSAYRTLV